jgi:hypothetical protein
MEDNPKPEPANLAAQEQVRTDAVPAKFTKPNKWWQIGSFAVIAVVVATQALIGWLVYTLRKDVADLKWSDAIHERDDDSVFTLTLVPSSS